MAKFKELVRKGRSALHPRPRRRPGERDRSGKLYHYWRDLPGAVWFCGANIYRRFVDSVSSPAVAVELGAWKGRSASLMGVEIANTGKPITFYTVDHFRGSSDEELHGKDPDLAADRLFETFLENIGPVSEHVHVIRSDTAAAAGQFDDESVDFLYIDASHTYGAVLADLVAWYPKVKPGGLMAGDDWCFEQQGRYGVREAVLEYFGPRSSDIMIDAGSEPNEDWLQWSIVKPRL